MTNMDKLYEAVEARGPVCVGLDTDFSYLPADFVDSTLTKGENIVRFNKKLIDATKAVAGCYKVQIAYLREWISVLWIFQKCRSKKGMRG